MQLGVVALDFKLLDLDQVAKPTIKRRLDAGLQCGGKLVAVAGEESLEDVATELRAIHSLAIRGEQNQFDHFAYMRIRIALGRAAAMVELERKLDVHFAVDLATVRKREFE